MKPMVSLRKNVIANFLGRTSTLFLAVLFTPVYISVLGMEAYGLIGFYITLQATIGFLEMGLGRACNRELSRHSGMGEHASVRMRDTLRSIELVYWLAALLIGISLSLLAPIISTSWLSASNLSHDDLNHLIIVIGWIIALRWPTGVYVGALMGLQQQVQMNVVQVIVAVINWGGAAVVLWLVRADIYGFFYWQLIVSIFATALFSWVAWRKVPPSTIQPRFSLNILKEIIPFVTGVGANALLGTLLRQADKLILSAILPLKQFAFYVLATMIANVVALIADAVSNAVFPRFSQLVGAHQSIDSIIRLYRFGTHLVASLIVPFALILAFFSYEFLYVYTGSEEIAHQTSLVLSVLVVAKMLHSSMLIPYALQLAYGWTKVSVLINLFSLALVVITVPIFAEAYGAIGAAFSWLCVTLAYVLLGMPLMHRRLLVGELSNWFENALIRPVIMVLLFLFAVSWISDNVVSDRWMTGLKLLGIFAASVTVTTFSVKELRIKIINEIRRI